MAEIQISKMTAKVAREIADGDEVVILMDGDLPVARVVPAKVELKSRANFFKHYPHSSEECLSSCWRHVPEDAEAVPA